MIITSMNRTIWFRTFVFYIFNICRISCAADCDTIDRHNHLDHTLCKSSTWSGHLINYVQCSDYTTVQLQGTISCSKQITTSELVSLGALIHTCTCNVQQTWFILRAMQHAIHACTQVSLSFSGCDSGAWSEEIVLWDDPFAMK